MGQSRDLLLQKSRDYLGNFQRVKTLAYENPSYQEHFKMGEALAKLILAEYKAGHLDGKDLYDSTLDLPSLFKLTKDAALKQEALALHKDMKKAIKKYLRD